MPSVRTSASAPWILVADLKVCDTAENPSTVIGPSAVQKKILLDLLMSHLRAMVPVILG